MSKAVNDFDLDDFLNNDSGSTEPAPAPQAPSQPAPAPKPAPQPAKDPVGTVSSEEEEKLNADLGPVDDRYRLVDTGEIKRLEMGQRRVEGTSPQDNQFEEDPDLIRAYIDVKESFAPDAEEKHINIKNNDHDNKMIEHVFGKYGIHDFDNLRRLTAPGAVDKVKEGFHKRLDKDGKPTLFSFDVYRSSFEREIADEKGNKSTEVTTFFKFSNRPGGNPGGGGSSMYSDYYKKHGGFPSYPDPFLQREADIKTNTFPGRILSTNINNRFKRFEIEFEPVLQDGGSQQYKDHVDQENIHSYLAFYKFADANDIDKIDKEKRSRQAGKISAALGVGDFVDWDTQIGEVKNFKIRTFTSQHGGDDVYRAYLD